MKYKQFSKLVSTVSFVVAAGFCTSHSLANSYDNAVQQNHSQGYGDFPPANIDQQLQQLPAENSQAVERLPRSYRSANPWSNQRQYTQPPTQNYPAPNYGSPYSAPYGGPGAYGPWGNRSSGFSPWGNRGGRNPFGHRGPGDWLDPSKGAMSRNWDDMLDAPSRMGEMPGGWTAPSVSMPNPIDVGEEFSDAAKDAPDQMDNFNWNNDRRRGYR